jgi:hypothetical protein
MWSDGRDFGKRVIAKNDLDSRTTLRAMLRSAMQIPQRILAGCDSE